MLLLVESDLDETEDEDKKKIRKVKNLDDTEQPIYPCEECTQCFTKVADLKVFIFYLQLKYTGF